MNTNQAARPDYFPHRKNARGGYDSICLNCFQTVATAKTEEELAVADASHTCPITDVSLLVARTKRDLQTMA